MRNSWLALLVGSLASAGTLPGQGFLSRSPNMGGTWLPERRALQFNFIHRFYVGPGPTHAVINTPTLTWAFRGPGKLAVGTRYSTRSTVPGETNEIDVFARWQFRESRPGRLGAAITSAWNTAAESFDGELGLEWSRGRFTLEGAARAMHHAYGANTARAALAGGLVFRVNSYVAVGGDYASLLDLGPGERAAWSGGLLFQIPNTPHFFTLQVSNADLLTIQGSSRRGILSGAVGKPLYGFEFTIPVHYKRFLPWFRPGTGVPPARLETAAAAEVRMAEFEFRQDTTVVRAGQAVLFVNDDPVEHTVTFDAIATSSGFIPRGGTFVLRFDRPGTWLYHCTPHPFMQGVIIVR